LCRASNSWILDDLDGGELLEVVLLLGEGGGSGRGLTLDAVNRAVVEWRRAWLKKARQPESEEEMRLGVGFCIGADD